MFMCVCPNSSVCSVGESSVADEVNEVLGGLSPNDLPDIESDDETEEGAEAAAEGIASVGLKSQEEEESDEDSDSDDDDSSQVPDDLREEGGGKIRSRAGSASMRPRAGSSGAAARRERHFWQYNVQAKGPKGQKIVVSTKIDDPHVLNDIVDPVFSGDVKLQGIKHRWELNTYTAVLGASVTGDIFLRQRLMLF